MILQALNNYYERLSADPEADVAAFGFSRQRIAYAVVIEKNGAFHSIEDLRTQEGKKLLARSLVVCGGAKPSGSGVNPCFLWDNPTYMLGYKPDDPKPERTLQCFEAFRQRHLDLEAAINDPEFSSVCRFLEKWETSKGAEQETLVDIATGFGLFRIRGAKHFVHEQPAIRDWWLTQIGNNDESSEETTGQCLVTGKSATIARLHEPKIKGVMGGQSAGAAIVSFNLDAFESYGKSQSNNSPVSELATFQYCTALNRLLADRSRRIQIGDATTVFWTEQKTEAENILGIVLGNPPPEDQAQLNVLQATLKAIASGQYPSNFGDQSTPFYVLGLSPNAARVSVRFWYVTTLGEFVKHLHQHFADLDIARSERDKEFIAPWQIIRETARESKDIPPLLSGALMRAILTGQPYPTMLLSALIRRIRADRSINHTRAATIKACLNRNTRFNISPLEKELPMSLDPDRADASYRLGRLFAELEKTQEDAMPGINDTIKDRYFGAASATPGSVFPRLIRMSQHHLGMLEKPTKTYHEKRIQEICSMLDVFPSHLNLKDQGLFAIGYYHQRQDIFTKKNKLATTNSEEE
ncbi:type I-C CRISPR-associated protein Cas8c/Csd1 [Thalassoglobus sp.]|uniref:type I-C CRISPR-associated protein Cas8c/Csd1 n=1 Tax=Thalassoglobus sp. TaxID=2795869 RepID=UPI003AA8F0AC